MYVCVCVCVCLSVCERERERVCVCVCMFCVNICAQEEEREREMNFHVPCVRNVQDTSSRPDCVLQILLNAGADPCSGLHDVGGNALFVASQEGHAEVRGQCIFDFVSISRAAVPPALKRWADVFLEFHTLHSQEPHRQCGSSKFALPCLCPGFHMTELHSSVCAGH